MPSRAVARLLRLSPFALAAVALAAGCVYLPPRRGGNIEVKVQIPGVQTGSVSYIGAITAVEKPDIPGVFACFNNVDPRCRGVSVSHTTGDVLTVPLVSGGAYSTVSTFMQFAPLQPGTWTVLVHIEGSAARDLEVCGVPVAANLTTTLDVESDPLGATAAYTVGKERSGRASIC